MEIGLARGPGRPVPASSLRWNGPHGAWRMEAGSPPAAAGFIGFSRPLLFEGQPCGRSLRSCRRNKPPVPQLLLRDSLRGRGSRSGDGRFAASPCSLGCWKFAGWGADASLRPGVLNRVTSLLYSILLLFLRMFAGWGADASLRPGALNRVTSLLYSILLLFLRMIGEE